MRSIGIAWNWNKASFFLFSGVEDGLCLIALVG